MIMKGILNKNTNHRDQQRISFTIANLKRCCFVVFVTLLLRHVYADE